MASTKDLMTEAMRLTRAGKLDEATALLSGGAPRRGSTGRARAGPRPVDLAETLRDLAGRAGPQARPGPSQDVPAGASWTRHEHRGPAGARPYALYVPSAPAPDPGLVVMLHGCTQDADDFARGTRMNEHAERHGFLVAYPEQPRAQNQNGCWNWFQAEDQGQAGEAAILAGIAGEVARTHAVGRTFAAGLSAGGAAAANVANAYPDVFARVCVHSGLPAGAASDLPAALSAMRSGATTFRANTAPVPMLIVHGDADRTVSAANADALERQALGPADTTIRHAEDGTANGRSITRTIDTAPGGAVLCERITVQGGGHAWFGGDAAGSHTDPKGPDTSAEAVRFFGLAR